MITLNLRTLIPGLIIAGFGVVGDAHGTTIFNNFGPDPAHLYDSTGWGIQEMQKQAMPFTALGNWVWTLTQIDVALQSDIGERSAILTLNSDNSGLPGGVLATWNLSALPLFDHLSDSCCLVVTVSPSSAVSLYSGQNYWLVASAVGITELDYWMLNNTGSTGNSFLQNDLGQWIQNPLPTLGAFDVQGVAPEPESLLLISIGVLALGGLRILKASR